jgi:hypothetical protein
MGLPIGLAVQSESGSMGLARTIGIVSGSIFLLLLIILLLVADYSRAWLIASDKPAFFKALGFGFSETFGHFWSSILMMLMIMVIMVLFVWLFSTVIGVWKPATGGGVFLFFLVSQILIFVKILLRMWRYGSVTALMEMNIIKNYD